MKKLILLVGIALGFVFGSKMGREPYERIEGKVRQLADRAEVEHAVEVVSAQGTENNERAADAGIDAIVDETSPSTNTAPKGTTAIARSAEDKTEAALDSELAKTFPSSDPPANWAGADRPPIAEAEVVRNESGEVEATSL